MKKICVYLGGRANYSSIKSFMNEVNMSDDFILQVVTGNSAVIDRFGDVSSLVEKDGFTISWRSYSLLEGGANRQMVQSTALAMLDLSTAFSQLEPDIVVVVGDRYEMMAPVLAAAYMNIRIMHTMGGEVTGTIDESIRHAITKFAHYHFAASSEAMDRILRLGEDPNYVFNLGCPRIDLVNEKLSNENSLTRVEEYFKRNPGVGHTLDFSKPFILLSQHPVTTEYSENRKFMLATLKAVQKVNVQCLLLWPNSDAGENLISKSIRTFRENNSDTNSWLSLHKNVPTDVYIHLLSLTKVLVGNSSSGIREGEFIGTPVVNIGSRQNSRQRGSNVIDVSNSEMDIYQAIIAQMEHGRYNSKGIYGMGNAAPLMLEAIRNSEMPRLQKTILY